MALPIRQGATHKVVIGPVVAVANGYVPVTTLTLSGADEAEVILHDNGTVVDISGYTFAAITTADGYYHLTLQSGISNTVGHMTVVINDDSLCLPVRQDFVIVEEAVYDQLYAASAPGAATVAQIGTNGAALSAIPWNASWDAEVQSEVQDAIVVNGLDHLVAASVAGTDVVDDSIVAKLVSSAATADWDTYVNTTDALQAIRDRGDAAWTTGGGGSISDIVSWTPLIPAAIDLANTKTYRLGIALTNMLDDLPLSASEITPGTISIDRSANGGTSWTAVVTDAACSEIDGLIYYDEVFDTATTYAAGDMLRITFKSQSVQVAANDYVISGSTGLMFYTGIIQTMPDVNVAQISGSATAANVLELFALALDGGTGQIDSGTFQTNAITASSIQDGAFTVAKFGGNVPSNVIAISGDTVAADNLEAYTDGTTPMPVNAIQISGDATAADNLEAALDGTGGVTIDAAIEVRSTGGTAGHNASDLVNSMLTTQMTEAYATDGSAPTVAQALLAIQQFLFDKDVSGTTLTVRRLDGTTAAMTFTLDSGSTPTDINRTG